MDAGEIVGNERLQRRVSVVLELALDEIRAAVAAGADVDQTHHPLTLWPISRRWPSLGVL
ncbi:MAG: hypothetical protein ACLP0J_25300 [Solirubrobacteraceae bacterium]